MGLDILGAGSAGLITGLNLLKKGFDVIIYDKKSEIGYPQHCTGIVSKAFLELNELPSKSIIRKLYGVSIQVEDKVYSVKSTIPKAYVIDRIFLEQYLANRVLEQGGKIYLNHKIDRLDKRKLYIDARGSWIYAIINKTGVLPAMQVDVRCNNIELDASQAHIIVNKKLNKDYFFWAVSIRDDIVRIGTASQSNLRKKLEKVLLSISNDCKIIRRYYGLIITGGPLKNFLIDNRILIGDAAGQVKPTTGGGLYYLSVAAKYLSRSLSEGYKEYSTDFYRDLGSEIKLQLIARKLFNRLDNKKFIDVLNILTKKDLLNFLMLHGDMDRHMLSLTTLLDIDFIKMFIKDPVLIKEVINAYI